MSKEIVKLDPKQYGLEEKDAKGIEKAFLPKIAEREAYQIMYNELITKELSSELCAEAGALRKKLVKVRTGIAEVHKTQKAFYLAAGKFVDAWKNMETFPVEQMETKLDEIENYYVNLEIQKLKKLTEDRHALLSAYCENPKDFNVGNMTEEAFSQLLYGQKAVYETNLKEKEKAERELKKLEIQKALETARKNKTIRLVDYIDNWSEQKWGEMTEKEFDLLCKNAIDARTKKEAADEAIRAENAKLKETVKQFNYTSVPANTDIVTVPDESFTDKQKIEHWIANISIAELPEIKDEDLRFMAEQVKQNFEEWKVWAFNFINQ